MLRPQLRMCEEAPALSFQMRCHGLNVFPSSSFSSKVIFQDMSCKLAHPCWLTASRINTRKGTRWLPSSLVSNICNVISSICLYFRSSSASNMYSHASVSLCDTWIRTQSSCSVNNFSFYRGLRSKAI